MLLANNWFYRFCFFLFLFFLVCNNLDAQKNNAAVDAGNWRLGIHAAIAREVVVDNNFSAIPYNGTGPGGAAFIQHTKGLVTQQLLAYCAAGTLTNNLNKVATSKYTYLNVSYNRLYLLSPAENLLTLKVGGAVDVLYNNRKYAGFVNNNKSFEFAASLAGLLEVNYFFENTLAGFSITDRISIPIVSSIMQPAYGSQNPSGSIGQDGGSAKTFLNSNRIASFPSFLRLTNCISLQKVIASGQILSLGYTWDYYRLNTNRQVKQANQRLAITYSFIL